MTQPTQTYYINYDSTYSSVYPTGNKPGSGAGTYTISGTGFGSDYLGAPYYDDFEGRTTGAASSSSLGGTSELSISNPDYVSVSATVSHSGSKSVKMDYAAASVAARVLNDPSTSLLFPKVFHNFSSATKTGYQACMVKWTGTSNPDNGNVWKFARFNNDGGVDPYNGVNSLSFNYTSSANAIRPNSFGGQSQGNVNPEQYWGTTPTTINPITEIPVWNPAVIFAPDTWHFYEIEFDVGDLNTANAQAEERWDKTVATHFGNGSNMTFRTTAHPNAVGSIMSAICGLDDYSNILMYMDEYYVDNSRARVVMTDSATYSSSTKYAIQPILSYSDTEVVVTKKRYSFSLGETAYLHLFNTAGVHTSVSSSFTVTEDNV